VIKLPSRQHEEHRHHEELSELEEALQRQNVRIVVYTNSGFRAEGTVSRVEHGLLILMNDTDDVEIENENGTNVANVQKAFINTRSISIFHIATGPED
jgi:hypothetical protein